MHFHEIGLQIEFNFKSSWANTHNIMSQWAVFTCIQVNTVSYVLNKHTVKKILDVCKYITDIYNGIYNGSMHFLY